MHTEVQTGTSALGRAWRRPVGLAAAAVLVAALAGITGGPPLARSAGAASGARAVLTGGQADPAITGSLVAPANLNAPVVGAATTPSGAGWWEVASDGGVFTFGDAVFHGSAGALHLNRPIVGMAATPDGGGYWLVASDGGIFTFGDAVFHGSAGALPLVRPIVGMASTPDGGGYWLVASDGGIFTFGDAVFHGSAGGSALGAAVVGMASTPDGRGYWLIAADGAVAAFGSAASAGTPPPGALAGRATGLVSTTSGSGYWITDQGGGVHPFGDAAALGSAAGVLGAPVVAAGRAAGGQGLRLVATDGSSVVLASGGPPALSASPVLPSIPAGNPSSYSFLGANTDGSPVRWNPCAPIHYETNLAEAPAGAAALVAGALAQVSAATGMTFVDDGSTTEIPGANRPPFQPARYGQRWAPVVIAWAHPSESDLLPGGNVIGEGGSSWAEAATGPKVFVSGEVVIDADNTGSLAPSFGAGSTLGELLLHELGHVSGLGHTTDPTQIMYPVLLPIPGAAYGAGDLAGLARLGQTAGCLTTPTP